MTEKNSSIYEENILIDEEYFSALKKDIHAAQHTIDLEVYIFSEDSLGMEIADALIVAAKRGVKIRVLVDGFGTRQWSKIPTQMSKAGIETKLYHPLFTSLFRWPLRLEFFKKMFHFITHINSRNHRKTCVIDKKIVYIGSANISKHSSKHPTKKWHDITVKIIGLNLNELFFAFEKAWHCIYFKKHYAGINKAKQDPIIRLNYTWRKRRQLYKSLLNKITKSKHQICIVSAYFVPKKFLLLKICAAARRGVEVCLILPKNPDVPGISLLTKSFYYILLKSGAKILHHTQGILHTKFFIIDDWICLGSSNLNFRSLHYDLEVDVELCTESAKKKIEKQFESYKKQSQPYTLRNLAQLTFFEKIAMKCLWVIRFLF